MHIGLFVWMKVDIPKGITLGHLLWHNSRLAEFCLRSLVLVIYYCTNNLDLPELHFRPRKSSIIKNGEWALCVKMGFYSDIFWESRCNIEINI